MKQRPEIVPLTILSDFSESAILEALRQVHYTGKTKIAITVSFSVFEQISDDFIADWGHCIWIAIPDQIMKNPHTWWIHAEGKIVMSEWR